MAPRPSVFGLPLPVTILEQFRRANDKDAENGNAGESTLDASWNRMDFVKEASKVFSSCKFGTFQVGSCRLQRHQWEWSSAGTTKRFSRVLMHKTAVMPILTKT